MPSDFCLRCSLALIAMIAVCAQSYEHYEKVKRERQERGMEMPPEPTRGANLIGCVFAMSNSLPWTPLLTPTAAEPEPLPDSLRQACTLHIHVL